MNKILITTTLLLFGFYANSQNMPTDFLRQLPSIPDSVCNLTVAQKQQFISMVEPFSDLVSNEKARREKESEKVAHENEAVTRANMMKKSGMSEEDMKNAKNMSQADKKAMADKMLQQNTNMSMDEAKNLSTMSEAGKKAYMEAYATEQMANAKANPGKTNPVAEQGRTLYELQMEQTRLIDSLSGIEQKFAMQFDAIINDPAGKPMLENIDKWHAELTSMMGVDYGQGPKMDTLSAKIKREKSKYCNQYTPKYSKLLKQYQTYSLKIQPAYLRLDDIMNKTYQAQTGINANLSQPGTTGLNVVEAYITRLKGAVQFNLNSE